MKLVTNELVVIYIPYPRDQKMESIMIDPSCETDKFKDFIDALLKPIL